MGEGSTGRLSAPGAKRAAQRHLDAGDSRLVVSRASRSVRYGVWLVDYRDPADLDAMLIGGSLVVTDEGDVHDISSVPGALDDLMLALGRWPGSDPQDVLDLDGRPRRPAADTDAEALLLLADEDPGEAAALAAWAADRRRERGEEPGAGRAGAQST